MCSHDLKYFQSICCIVEIVPQVRKLIVAPGGEHLSSDLDLVVVAALLAPVYNKWIRDL